MDDLLANVDSTKKQSTVKEKNSSLYESLVVEIRQGRETALPKRAGWLRTAAASTTKIKVNSPDIAGQKQVMNKTAIEIYYL